MTQITLVLPYPISANRYWRPVKLGKHISIVPTKEAKAYKAEVATRYRGPQITGRYLLEVFLFPNRPQDWQKRQRQHGVAWDDTVMCIDLGNCEKVLSDALRGVAIEDDKWAREIVLIRMEPDQHGARAVVRITALSVDEPQLPIDLPAESAEPIATVEDDDEPPF